MGVKGLWRLLLPIGRRISIETLEGKILAIDASIWLTQFVKAMRDPDTGSVRPAAHLLGFFRRLCKLLFHGIRPVLVFDGATPEIKLREVALRRKRREAFSASQNRNTVELLAKRILQQQLQKKQELEKVRKVAGTGAATAATAADDGIATQAAASGAFDANFQPDEADDDNDDDKAEKATVYNVKSNAVSVDTTVNEADAVLIQLQEEEWLQNSKDEEKQANMDENDWDDNEYDEEDESDNEEGDNKEVGDDNENNDNDQKPRAPRRRGGHSAKAKGNETPVSLLTLEDIWSLPPNARKDAIEQAERRQRLLSRREFMPVAGDMVQYSQVQITNFLRSAKLKQNIVKMAKASAAASGQSMDTTSTIQFDIEDEDNEEEDGMEEHNSHNKRMHPYQRQTRKRPRTTSTGTPPKERTTQRNLPKVMQLVDTDNDDDDEEEEWEDQGFITGKSKHSVELLTSHPSLTSPTDENVQASLSTLPTKDNQTKSTSERELDAKSSKPTTTVVTIDVDEDENDDDESDDDQEVRYTHTVRSVTSNADTPTENHTGQRGGTLTETSTFHRTPPSVTLPFEQPTNVENTTKSSNNDQVDGISDVGQNLVSESASTLALASGFDAGDDEVDWEDGATDDVDIRSAAADTIARPELKQPHQMESHGLPLNWEADGVSAMGTTKIRLIAHSGDEEESDEGEEVGWEEGEHETDGRSHTHAKSNSATSIHYVAPFSKKISPSVSKKDRESQTAAALLAAQATAANLTNWAGRAFRRAIEQHANETGTKLIDKTKADILRTEAIKQYQDLSGSPGENDNDDDDDDDDRLLAISPTSTKLDSAPSIPPKLDSSSVVQLQSETSASAATINLLEDSAAKLPPTSASVKDTTNLMELLEEQVDVLNERGKRQERDMDTVTDEMKADVVQLIQLFGIPYIEAPAEAEAQCVELERLGLVDGVVTEDSDVFVFGGRVVYKNIFDDQKYVEVYRSDDAEKDLALGRNQFMALAMLLGGDYTEGVKGVGIVNGMEILQEFDVSDDLRIGLTQFREWLHGFGDKSGHVSSEFHLKHKSARTRWTVPDNFPSEQVMTAYQSPVVDNSRDRFSWGVPDVESLCRFAQYNIGWTAEETKGYLRPVVQKLREGSRQTRINSYFMKYEDGIKFAKVRSKRLRDVFRGIHGDSKSDPMDGHDDDDDEVEASSSSAGHDKNDAT